MDHHPQGREQRQREVLAAEQPALGPPRPHPNLGASVGGGAYGGISCPISIFLLVTKEKDLAAPGAGPGRRIGENNTPEKERPPTPQK